LLALLCHDHVKIIMKHIVTSLVCLLISSHIAIAQTKPPLLPEPVVAALSAELSGETAKRNLEYISRHHRMRASRGFRAAAEFIAEQARSYGLDEVSVLQFPADGKTFYGTQKARPAWDAEFAELWEMSGTGQDMKPVLRVASWDAMPLTLAQDSESAMVTAELIDVGNGTDERDYVGREVRGKIVLVTAQPEAVARLPVDRYGAAGILSYAQNQRTGWSGENDNLIRWGHLDSFTPTKTFAFMLSLKQARAFQTQLTRGEKITLHANVRAGRHEGFYDVVTAIIPGADPRLRDEEIAFSCHLDHPRPGANDNASGSMAILEVARALAKLIREGKIPRPARTIRFIWPPEIEGTLALLNARPDLSRRIRADIHMDMVGGAPETKAIFHITRGPASLPSFINDVAEEFGAFVNEQSARYASGASAAYALVAPEGGKEPLLAELSEFSMGSDHQVYTDSSFAIPAIYLNDWPDRYIHTNYDTPANVDPTKLKRAGFIGAASGYFLANLKAENAPALWRVLQARSLRRTARLLERRAEVAPEEAANLTRFHFWYERALVDSMERFFRVPAPVRAEAMVFMANQERLIGEVPRVAAAEGEGRIVFRRNPNIKGPMSAFGYDYFTDHYGEERAAKIRLFNFQGLRGAGGEYAYEALNLVDGKRTAQEIRDAVSAIYGPVPLDLILEYLHAEEIKVVQKP
jgi:aminopeptidase YwaD